ncbi:hypothetical protein GW915_10335 [bacterium]|nr:hypothetical protein [bacterium]
MRLFSLFLLTQGLFIFSSQSQPAHKSGAQASRFDSRMDSFVADVTGHFELKGKGYGRDVKETSFPMKIEVRKDVGSNSLLFFDVSEDEARLWKALPLADAQDKQVSPRGLRGLQDEKIVFNAKTNKLTVTTLTVAGLVQLKTYKSVEAPNASTLIFESGDVPDMANTKTSLRYQRSKN